MQFSHVHCSSRFSRAAASLESAVDTWRTKASVITLTEVGESARRRTLSEAGWGVYQASGEIGAAECATCWDLDIWQATWSQAMRLIGRWPTSHGGTLWAVYANTVILKHKVSGHTVLFSTIHTPNKIGGPSGFMPQLQQAQPRIEAYTRCMVNWDSAIAKIVRERKPDCVVLNADFNVNFRTSWFPNYLRQNFKDIGLQVAWKHFTSAGTFGHAIIDGSLYRGLSTTGSVVIPDVNDSTDHTPFRTSYATTSHPGSPVKVVAGGQSPQDDAGEITGQGTAWWNFNDYGDDALYEIEQA